MTNIEASGPHRTEENCGSPKPFRSCFMTKKVTELPARCFKLKPIMHALTSHCTQRAGNLKNCHPYLYETMLFDLLRFQHGNTTVVTSQFTCFSYSTFPFFLNSQIQNSGTITVRYSPQVIKIFSTEFS